MQISFKVHTKVLLTLSILMGFPIQIKAITMGLSILCFNGLEFPKYDVYLTMMIVFILANSVGYEEMLHLLWVFKVCQSTSFTKG